MDVRPFTKVEFDQREQHGKDTDSRYLESCRVIMTGGCVQIQGTTYRELVTKWIYSRSENTSPHENLSIKSTSPEIKKAYSTEGGEIFPLGKIPPEFIEGMKLVRQAILQHTFVSQKGRNLLNRVLESEEQGLVVNKS